jgi:hypothetical protein
MRCKKCGGVKVKTYIGLPRPVPVCRSCLRKRIEAEQATQTAMQPTTCPGCGLPALDGQRTCGRYACVEAIQDVKPATETPNNSRVA